MKEYVQHQVNGLLFEHRSTTSLVEQMTYAILNTDKMNEYGERGYLYSSDGEVPDITHHCCDLEGIYSRILSKNLWRITIDSNPEDCNLNCMMCEEHSPFSTFKKSLYNQTGVIHRRMDPEILEHIFTQAKQLGVKEIIPSTMGEPLLYKGIERIFELSKRLEIKINLTTNGTFPRFPMKKWAEMIIPNTTDIKISWNGATVETAEKIMTGLNFKKALENVQALISYRDDYFKQTSYYCRITFQLTFMNNNMHELAEIVKLAAELGIDRVKGHHLWTHFEELKQLSMKSDTNSIQLWNYYVEQALEAQQKFRKKDGQMVLLENIFPLNMELVNEVPEHFECPFLRKELWISATGILSPCCAPDSLRQSLGDFGNIHETTLLDVMTSEKYLNLIKNYKQNSLCKTCNMRKPQSK